MVRLARKIHFNAGRSLWRADWPTEKNRAVYGAEGPHGYGHNYALEVAVEGEVDPETSMVVTARRRFRSTIRSTTRGARA